MTEELKKMDPKWKISTSIWKLSLFCKRTYRTKKHCMIVVFSLFIITIYLINFNNENVKRPMPSHKHYYIDDKGSGCEMPKLDPYSPAVMEFNREMPKIVCDNIDWVECYKSECYVFDNILQEMSHISCIYKDIVYVNDHSYFISDPVKIDGGSKYLLNKSDHVKVSCTGAPRNGIGILSSRWFGYKAGLRNVPTAIPPVGRENTLNIMILCFDSASHNGVIRKLPKTYEFLKEELNATILRNYNIVGEGTSHALYPILTGLDLPDWETFPKNECMKHETFLFHHLKQDGYRTAYFEDMPWIGTFQRFYNGFDERPADHYLRSFIMEESQGGRKWWHGLKGRYCIGNIAEYALMLKLSEQFLSLDGKRFCFTFIADISHDDFNMISTADDDVVNFLRGFRDSGNLEDTLLVVMGDHGAKYDSLRKTYQGRIEERLPLVTITLPQKLIRERLSALNSLRANAEVLTTPYDLHATLLDVVGLNEIRSKFKVPGSDLPRSMSLLEPIPKSRSCGEAGILPQWCACTKWRNVSESDPLYRKAAEALAEYIDNITLEKRSLCARRNLMSIEWVMRKQPHAEMMHLETDASSYFNKVKTVVRQKEEYYQVKIALSPGEAIFEAVLIYYVEDDFYFIREQDISRISAYGDEPHCVTESSPHLNKYCYCKEEFKRKDDFIEGE